MGGDDGGAAVVVRRLGHGNRGAGMVVVLTAMVGTEGSCKDGHLSPAIQP